ncbi:MAG: hypothetical protein ACKOK8_09365, partial [Planctomycetia bacterium]
MRKSRSVWWRLFAGSLCLACCAVAAGQEQDFVGRPGSVGSRIDLLYGEDFPNAMSLGWETNPGPRDWNSGEYYGIAIPQLYG